VKSLITQFFRFGLVGVAGFVVDVSVLYLGLKVLGVGPYVGRGISYLAAATSTWYLNRRITFADRRSASVGREWLKFVLLNGAGGVLNYVTYTASLHYLGSAGAMPALGVALGSLAGMLVNFTVSRQFVFSKTDASRAIP
jgi:putative flippase GtrA